MKKSLKIFVHFVVFIHCIATIPCQAQVYSSCKDALQKLKQNATDGEYVIQMGNFLGVSIYCDGMSTGHPSEYLTLKSARSNNFASYYQYVGSANKCVKSYPPQVYNKYGRVEFNRIRLNIKTLVVDTFNAKFAVYTPGSMNLNISYASAGDEFSSSPSCAPMGAFKVDFSGTPFKVNDDVVWSWIGHYSNGSTHGFANINKQAFKYIGCYKDLRDRAMVGYQHLGIKGLTTEMCVQQCISLGFLYAGTQYGQECFCGNSYNKNGKADETTCSYACNGKHTQKCGGFWRLSVYSTGVSQSIDGKCGGFPGECYPSLVTDTTRKFKLQIVSSHPCNRANPCENDAVCIATSAHHYSCECKPHYFGANCDKLEEIVSYNGSLCPPQFQPEQCECSQPLCYGAAFQGEMCSVLGPAGNTHVSQQILPKVTCRYSDPAHVHVFTVDSHVSVHCPQGSVTVGCSYWDSQHNKKGSGKGVIDRAKRTCSIAGCNGCKIQAVCRKYSCGCQNGGTCRKSTGLCLCKHGYYGDKCEIFDLCSYYEDAHGYSACTSGGICQSVPVTDIATFAGNSGGKSCSFPFKFDSEVYGRCVEDNSIGPPFACGSVFDGVNSFIDIGPWSLGPVYSIAVWMRPDLVDNKRRTVIGGVGACRDSGIHLSRNKIRGYAKTSGCTHDLVASNPQRVQIGQWYHVALTNNGTSETIYVNGVPSGSINVHHFSFGTPQDFRIGGEVCCKGNNYKGVIKSVKLWNRALSAGDVSDEVSYISYGNATVEAIDDGLVGYWELGKAVFPPCKGVNHHGEDWTVQDQEILNGTHCNVGKFYIPRSKTAFLKHYDGTSGGIFKLSAKNIIIDGTLNGDGAGYTGAHGINVPSQNGNPGGSYTGGGKPGQGIKHNKGGGGGGTRGKPGGGGGYGTAGKPAVSRHGHGGQGGIAYGDAKVSTLFQGSGGGSGGSSANLKSDPPGGKGGNGGGAIRLLAEETVSIRGMISVNGEDGQGDTKITAGCSGCPAACSVHTRTSCFGNNSSACWDMSGPGGGGSGGSIYITGQFVDVGHDHVLAVGGNGGFGSPLGAGCGGDGGMGRIRIESEIFAGVIGAQSGVLSKVTLTNTYMDLSQTGQELINLQTTVYGNEVYRGCFLDSQDRLFTYTVSHTSVFINKMTPQYCIKLCRKQGFKFSGTQAGSWCFCDNHLDMSKKRSDNECNNPCPADRAQFCGGNWRMTVYGPPPATPAVGHGVTRQCQPWCRTDAVSNSIQSVKWGLCSLDPRTPVTWKTQCDCPAGRTGPRCEKECSNWTWGKQCSNNCTCEQNTTVSCNIWNGICRCLPGYMGSNCQTACPAGYYGDQCSNKCSCGNQAKCNKTTGDCMCTGGWTGPDCTTPCPFGTFGVHCKQVCRCIHGTCSPIDGQCECDQGYKLPSCYNKCDPDKFGPNCAYACKCNGHPCHAFSGLCKCNAGYTGPHCEFVCPFGTWGPSCSNKCKCSNNAACDHVTGRCQCPAGFVGDICDMPCIHFTYGMNCASTCSCVQANTAYCDNVSGKCTCKAGFTGQNCSVSCPTGFYGQNCGFTCNCLHGSPCDKVTGLCKCLPGFTGSNCSQTCQVGFFGQNCTYHCQKCHHGVCSMTDGSCICGGTEPCLCPKGYWGSNCQRICNCVHGYCDASNGKCHCYDGWTGSLCNQMCPARTFGKNCQSKCNCVHGTCNALTGECSCQAGYMGVACDQQCKMGFYGPNCIAPCPQCGLYADQGCDVKTGDCKCHAGFQGYNCGRPCAANTYGPGCSSSCSCPTGQAYCDNVNGQCHCHAGFTGKTCSDVCPYGRWGLQCAYTCNCGSNGAGCDPYSGVCHCKSGYSGVRCQETCPPGLSGINCLNPCVQCDLKHSVCNPFDGTCQCDDGYSGKYCDTMCTQGKWGKNCVESCMCSNHGTCNPITGQCDCAAGFRGNHCNIPCPAHMWGKNCANRCSCSTGVCNPSDGSCSCPPGKTGHSCQNNCDSSHFGIDCNETCLCMNGATCDSKTGNCLCPPGWIGNRCNQQCPPNRFGVGCSQICQLCQHGGSCNQQSGDCFCPPGYTGTQCQQVCSQGMWGKNCLYPCPNACNTCDHVTGECKCGSTTCQNGGTCGSDGSCVCATGYFGFDCTSAVGSMQQSQNHDNSNMVNLTVGGIVGIILGVAILFSVATGVGVHFLKKRKKVDVRSLIEYRDNSVSFRDIAETASGKNKPTTAGGLENPLYEAVKAENLESDEREKSDLSADSYAGGTSLEEGKFDNDTGIDNPLFAVVQKMENENEELQFQQSSFDNHTDA